MLKDILADRLDEPAFGGAHVASGDPAALAARATRAGIDQGI